MRFQPTLLDNGVYSKINMPSLPRCERFCHLLSHITPTSSRVCGTLSETFYFSPVEPSSWALHILAHTLAPLLELYVNVVPHYASVCCSRPALRVIFRSASWSSLCLGSVVCSSRVQARTWATMSMHATL